MKRFKHIHLSSRYDRSPQSLKKVVESYITTASIITFTEVDAEAREAVLRNFEGWGFVAGDKTGRDDCAIMWKSSEWTVLHKETFNVAKYMAGNIGVAAVVLRHKDTGRAIVVSVVHLPSAVQGYARVSGGRADEWYRARRNWIKRTKELKKRFDADAMLAVADWNIDWKLRWVRSLIRSVMPSWKNPWTKTVRKGTHGNRLIDFTMYKGNIRVAKHPSIHNSTTASDHRAYEEVFAWKT